MANATVPLTRRRFLQTQRRDIWWVKPLVVFLILGSFVAYSTWAAFQNAYYTFGPYLSPFYSPEIFGSSPHALLGPKPGWWPGFVPFSPALLILPFPAFFRFTCYYYRGSYYKSFWSDPPACSVGEPRKTYLGERSFPLILQNVHRYFMYAAVVFLFILAYDAWKAFWWADPATGAEHFGIGLELDPEHQLLPLLGRLDALGSELCFGRHKADRRGEHVLGDWVEDGAHLVPKRELAGLLRPQIDRHIDIVEI